MSDSNSQENAPLREGPGTRIGPYTLLNEIGEGGFGVVFLAEQTQPVARKVALKIIKLGMDTHQVVARFEQERQALALMDHPNIARVIDAGATDTGRPYFVMDLVIGAPIAEYCDTNNLSIDERLELFAQVCNAVQHAHSKGIIHRDIKPSNILVATQDGKPQAKVIDFGIAKATSAKLTDKSLLTEHQQVIGTLQYMSPEQAEGSLDIDTRTDVYALGVVLYELLTGSPPLELKTLRSAMYDEIQRLIREVDPPKPSTRLNQSTDTLPSIAAHRRVDPKRLGAIVRGELDWIVMKALEKDRARRYESASGFALDIRRYLDGDAVVAAPPSAMYRFTKFVRRNKATVIAGCAIAAALLIGAIGFAWQASVARVQRDLAVLAGRSETKARRVADEQRVIAESNEKKATAINQFLLDMLGSANVRALGRDAKVSQALDRAAAIVGTSFADRPDVEAAVRAILGSTYVSIGMLDAAETQLRAALALDERVYGDSSAEYAHVLGDLGTIAVERHQFAAAAETLGRAAELMGNARGPEDELTVSLRVCFANALVDLDRLDDAEPILRDALAIQTRVHGRDSRPTQVALNSLAVLLHTMKRLDEAEQLYRESVDVGTRVLGPRHPDTLTARFNLGTLLRSRGKVDEAEPILAAAYADIRQVFGDAHPRTAEAAQNLGALYSDSGRYKDALPLLEACAAIRTGAGEENTESLADSKRALARCLARLGETARATTLLRDVYEIYRSTEGATRRNALYARLDLANDLAAANLMTEAEALFVGLAELIEQVAGADDPQTIIATNSYAVLLMRQSRFADALPLLRKAFEAGRRVEGEDDRDTLVTMNNLMAASRELGYLEEAEALGRECIERFARVFGPKHPNTAVVRRGYADTLARMGRADDAMREYTEAIAIHKAAVGADNPAFAGDAISLARLLLDAGRAEEAKPILDEALQVVEKTRGPQHWSAANARLELGRYCASFARFAEAEPLFNDAYAIHAAGGSPDAKDIRRAEKYLAGFYAAWNAAEPNADRAAKAAEWKAKVDARN